MTATSATAVAASLSVAKSGLRMPLGSARRLCARPPRRREGEADGRVGRGGGAGATEGHRGGAAGAVAVAQEIPAQHRLRRGRGGAVSIFDPVKRGLSLVARMALLDWPGMGVYYWEIHPLYVYKRQCLMRNLILLCQSV